MEKKFIYTLSHPITEEIRYIGKTNNIEKRLRSHLSNHQLLDKTKKNNWIISLLRDNLIPKIEVLDETTDNNINELEIFYISLFKSWGFRLLNMTDGGDGISWKGKKHSEESKIKNLVNSPHRKSVGQYDIYGDLIKEYHSIREAANETNSDRSHISRCCNNKKSYYTHNGFIWKFIENINEYGVIEQKKVNLIKYDKPKKEKIVKPIIVKVKKEKIIKEKIIKPKVEKVDLIKYDKPKLQRANITKIKVFTLTGELLEICNGYRDIEEKYGCHRELVSRCCKEKGFYQTKNLTFRYENDEFDYVPYKNFRNNKTYKIGLYNEDGELIQSFNSLKDAVADTKIAKQYISKNCNDNLEGNNIKIFNRKKDYFIFKFLDNPYLVK